ncbi:MAG TPA: hypothetical protein VFS44_07240 [Gemmatimonadaceae bacterium]|nr:hypothetical protein [Gemmatimonadaceae bacterium]
MKSTDEFQYLTVLVSIILGLGLTQLLTAVGRLVQARALVRVRLYWPVPLWTVLLLLMHVQAWWAMFDLRDHRGWTYLEFLVVLLTPTCLYLMAALALPDVAETIARSDLSGAAASGGEPASAARGERATAGERVLDFRAHYYAQTRWFFGAAAGLLVSSLLRPLVIDGRLPLDLDRGFQVVFLALLLGAAVTRRKWYHETIAAVGAALFLTYVVLLFTHLR